MNITNALANPKLNYSTIQRGTMRLLFLSLAAILAAAPVLAKAQAGTIPNPYTQTSQGMIGLNPSGQTQLNPGSQSTETQTVGSRTIGTPTGIIGPSGSPQMLATGQGAPASSMTLLYPDPTTYTLSPGDLISVRLYEAPDYCSIVRITKDGTVQLPLIGSVSLSGITINAAQALIASRLKTAGMYRDPQVLIGIAESASPQIVSFIGEKSGTYLIQGQRNLLDVLASAGGLPQNSSRILNIIRPGVEAPILVNLGSTPQDLVKANIPIQAHDTIFVERAGSVYMLGAFKQQGALPLNGTPITLMQAATLAGGPNFAGKYADMRVIRTIGTERTEVKVDIKRIMFGLDPDPILQPGDICFLPTQLFKQALASGGIQTLISAVGILVLAAYR